MALLAFTASRPLPPHGTREATLPDPTPLLRNLSRGVLEAMSGARDPEQLARWLTEDAYRKIVAHSTLASHFRARRGIQPSLPSLEVRDVHVTYPSPRVAEGVVIVTDSIRTRAMALRAEAHGGRWRATFVALI